MTLIRESFGGAWQRNVEVKLDNVAVFSAVYACWTLIANDIAKLRLRLVELDANGIWAERDSAAFSPVLRKPNPYQTRIEFIQHWVASKLLYGNTYVLKERDARGVVVAFYVLEPSRVRVLVADNGDVFYELRRDALSGLDAETINVPATEITHDKMNTFWHPLVGISPIQACGVAATQGLRIQSTSANFFGNGARPSGILTAPNEIAQDTADRLREVWETKFSGENSGKIAVLGDGLKFEPMMMSAVDAQLIEQLRWSAETVCSCFHVPPYMIGVGSAPTYNNVEALAQAYYSQCLQIHIEQIEALLDEALKLGPGFGNRYGTEFDLDDLLRMDTATMVKTYGDATQRGMAPNEFRRKLNLPPKDGGDTPLLQEQMWPLAALSHPDRPLPGAKQEPAKPLALPAPDEEPEDETERAIAALRFKYAEALHAA